MKKSHIFFAILLLVIVYYKTVYTDFTYRYRMTVEVETPEGIKSGSSVIEVRTEQWPEWLSGLFGGHTESSKVTGEAVFVDLGNEKNIVVLLSAGSRAQVSDTMIHLAPQAFFDINVPESNVGLKSNWANRLSKMTGDVATLKPEEIPTIVSFENLNDPKSVKLIYAADPYEINAQGWREFPRKVVVNNFDTEFGEGFELRSMRLELTTDPVTKGKLIDQLTFLNNPELGEIYLNTPYAKNVKLWKEQDLIIER